MRIHICWTLWGKYSKIFRGKFWWHSYDRNATGYGYSYSLGFCLITTWWEQE